MTRLMLALAVLALSLSGCVAYGGDYAYPGYSVRYYDSSPSYRVYYYDDDRDYRWHRDRYQDRRHSHYAPNYDGRYLWHDERGRYERHREQNRRYVQPQNHQGNQNGQGWQQPRQQSWKPNGGHQQRSYSRERERDRKGREGSWEQQGKRQNQPANSNLRGWNSSR